MVICPTCRKRFKAKDKVCPRCGWIVQEIYKSNCPFCGELIPINSKECPRCGVDLSSPDLKEKLLANPPIETPPEASSPEPAEQVAEATRYSCPKCAAELEGTEPECPVCGQVLIGRLGLRCPVCAATVGKGRRRCPTCGSDLKDITKLALPMVPEVKEPPQAIARAEEEAIALEAEETPKEPKPSVSEPTRTQEPELVPEIKAEPEIEAPSEAPEPSAEETAVTQPPEPAPEPEEPEPVAEQEAERVTVIDYGVRPPERGLTNGVAHVNGRGMVNGTGAVNGKAFVNGTGSAVPPGVKQGRGSRSPTGWRFLTVLLAIVIVVSAFAFLSYPGNRGKYAVDGSFAEWHDATLYGSRVASTTPSLNITEWAVATEGSSLLMYFKTQGPMMSSTEPHSFYLLVDSDGLNSTGYALDSIGADYMLQLVGWNGSVSSSTVFRYSSSSDHLNWNAWTSISSLQYSTDGQRVEAGAGLPSALASSARFVMVSEDASDHGSISYVAPLKGAVLVVEQVPSTDVALDGLVAASNSVDMLKVRFTSEGGSGQVQQVTANVKGGTHVTQVEPFSLGAKETREIDIALDTSMEAAGTLVSAEITAGGIASSYAVVEIVGSGANAYVVSPPSSINIDGAFADWDGRLWTDSDSAPVTNPNVDIHQVGNASNALSSFFYVSVKGGICEGAYIPATVVKPSGSGSGGGAVVLKRQTAEDVLRIYVDSDKSNSTGERITLSSRLIGADQLIEVRGLFGRITSAREFVYTSSSLWNATPDAVTAALDDQRIEIRVSKSSLAGASDIDFIVETTSWRGQGDSAAFDTVSTKTWVVDPLTSSPYATAMSYQRKLFYDGVNFWSFFFDGSNTVCKYSYDDGQTWTNAGRVFTTGGVNETSIWYDPSTKMVYAVGDVPIATNNVFVQGGVVDAAAHKISWATSDSVLKASTNAKAGKNTYISKDMNGYLWVLSTNWTEVKPLAHDLSAFRSRAVNSTSSWTNTGEILPYGMYEDNSVGSLVPAGSGSDMWVVYSYAGYVSAKKYNGAWPADYDEVVIYKQGTSWANTDNSPPSVVVDGKGVVHVAYGTGRQNRDKVSIPQILYSHNLTDGTFTPGVNLDPANDTRLIANYWPTISLDSSTNSLYVIWLQCDSTFTPRTVLGMKCISGLWTSMSIEPQTTFVKRYMTSIYSAPDQFKIGWQWTQNSTAPIDVMYDSTWIPEFGDAAIALPICGLVAIFVAYRRVPHRRGRGAPSSEED